MPHKFNLEQTMEKMNRALKSRGAEGIRGLGRAFRIVDKNKSGDMDRPEFTEAMRIWKMDMKEAEISILMAEFDEDGDGQISYDEFLKGVRGEMSERRLNLVRKAYAVLDVDGSGTVTLSDIMAEYDVSFHPEVKAGSKEPEEVYKEFMDGFEGSNGDGDGTVTMDEFIDYYEGVSASVDADDYFVFMMGQAWKVQEHPGEVVLGEERVGQLANILREKLTQRKVGSQTESKALSKSFQYFNLDDTNMVDQRCFARTIEKFGLVLEPPEMQGWFSHFDTEGEGAINFEAFIHGLFPEEACRVRESGAQVTPGRRGMDSPKPAMANGRSTSRSEW